MKRIIFAIAAALISTLAHAGSFGTLSNDTSNVSSIGCTVTSDRGGYLYARRNGAQCLTHGDQTWWVPPDPNGNWMPGYVLVGVSIPGSAAPYIQLMETADCDGITWHYPAQLNCSIAWKNYSGASSGVNYNATVTVSYKSLGGVPGPSAVFVITLRK